MSGSTTTPPEFMTARNAAAEAYDRGDLSAAKKHFLEALNFDPNSSEVLHRLGLVCQRMGSLSEGTTYLVSAASLDPDDAVIQNNLGNILAAQNNLDDAVSAYKEAIRIEPDYVNATYNLANSLVKSGKLKEAIAAYRRTIELAPEDLDAYNELAMCLLDSGEHDAAGELFRAALAIDPTHADTNNNFGVYLMQIGEIESARVSFANALKYRPNYGRAYENLARSRRFVSNDSDIVERLETLTRDTSASRDDQMLYHFALGKILDDMGRYQRAFEHYLKGNSIKRASVIFDRQGHIRWVDRVIATYTPSLLDLKRDFGNTSELPVFIIGMIRSGTTLVEQIIASHPSVAGGGELRYFPKLAANLPRTLSSQLAFPECAKALDSATVSRKAEEYLSLLKNFGASEIRITDKLPTNFLFLGLIYLLFPRARVIHCVRDPMDVCLSIFFQRFASGHSYAYDLEDIASYYNEYVRLMDHWKQVLPMRILEIQYETLVADQERVTREITNFLDIKWDPTCLQFEQTRRVVSTASNWQVRQPIYTNSVSRWRQYEPFIEPLRAALGNHASGAGGAGE